MTPTETWITGAIIITLFTIVLPLIMFNLLNKRERYDNTGKRVQ